jgi:tripeptide aminopeptidase
LHVSFRGLKDTVSSVGRLFRRRRAGGSAKVARSETGPYVNRIISDAILFNEIPSPTEREAARTDYVLQRLGEFGYQDASVDDFGNVTAVVPARDNTEDHVLLFADIRCEDYSPVDSMTKLEADRVLGKGIAESSVAAAALMVLAEYLIRNEIQYDRTVVLLFTSFDPGEPETQPLEHFLQSWKDRLRFAAHVRGLELGRVEDRPLGTCKLSVKVRTEERAVAAGQPSVSAIWVLASIASRLGSIRWDTENNTFMNISRLEAGVGFGWYASEGVLELEIFSPSAATLDVARKAVEATIAGIAAETGAAAEVSMKAFLPAGDSQINQGLTAMVRAVYDRLHIKPRPVSLPGYTSFLNSLGIPAVTLGVTTGAKSYTEEFIHVRPVELGFRQLLAFLDDCAGWHGGELP